MNYISFSDYMSMDNIILLSEKELGLYKHKTGGYITIFEYVMQGYFAGHIKQFKRLTVFYYWDEKSFEECNYDVIPEFGNSKTGKQLRSGKEYIRYNNKRWQKVSD